MKFSAATEGQLRILSVGDTRIDAAAAIEFKDEMRRQIDTDAVVVVLDLSHVEFIDSSGLGAIVAALKYVGPDRKLVLAGLTPTVEKVFHLTRMDTVFSIHKTLDDAMSELRK